MFNPTRRNRNIGTAKQGFGQDNSLVIPRPLEPFREFYERLENYSIDYRTINNHEFVFITEETRKDSAHACTIRDISEIIKNIPKADYGDLRFIVLRQPKRKEEIKSSVWGRLIYSYEFENDYFPAIILEAQSRDKKLKWSRKLGLDGQKELKRLKEDGHIFQEDKRNYIAEFDLNSIRNTQLYRTLIHEFGHYVHYLEFVEKPSFEEEEFSEWEKRNDRYFQLPSSEKEKYAHNYADKLKKELTENGVIPFDKKE